MFNHMQIKCVELQVNKFNGGYCQQLRYLINIRILGCSVRLFILQSSVISGQSMKRGTKIDEKTIGKVTIFRKNFSRLRYFEATFDKKKRQSGQCSRADQNNQVHKQTNARLWIEERDCGRYGLSEFVKSKRRTCHLRLGRKKTADDWVDLGVDTSISKTVQKRGDQNPQNA